MQMEKENAKDSAAGLPLCQNQGSLPRQVGRSGEDEELVRALMEIPFDYFWLVDTEGILIDCNRKALELMGENLQDCIGRTVWQKPGVEPETGLRDQFGVTVVSGLPLRVEVQRQGNRLDRQLQPICDRKGRVSLVAVFEKETDAEKKLHDLLLNYKYLDAVRSLAAGVAHNYNNIFGGLIGQFTLLRRQSLSDSERDEALALIDELLQRGARISSKLSPFARQVKEVVRVVEPAVVIQEAAELLSLLSSSHRIVPQAEENLPNLRCTPRQLLLVLYNLGRNAIEAMPEGGTVEIRARRGDDRFDPMPSVVLSVSDQGKGIPEQYRSRIFEPFFSSKQFGNLQEIGLGLYTVKNYVLTQRGQIEFDTAHERGSIFRLILPALPEGVKGENDGSPEPIDETLAGENETREEGSPQVILVVEDEEALRSMITRRLQKAGNIVFSVGDGQEAIAEYAELHDTINIVIMDAGLPDMTGQQCVRKLLEIDPALAVLYTSGHCLEGEELFPLGSPLLVKPFNGQDLNKAIGHARKRSVSKIS